ncbi:MAG TPA: DUF2164 domain-containing protein [Methanoregulaceae archaeon]|nr:DUF2164 domain-containing protein [Methanoregulaceae archaeon]
MKKYNSVKLTPEKRDEMVAAVKNYFLRERGEELGNLAAGLVLDFITEELAPEFYNQGVYDSYRCMQDMIEDLLAIQK